MNNEQEINRRIQDEYNQFNTSIYSGQPSLPKDFLERFKKAVWKVPPTVHRLPTELIKKILAKKLKDLNNFDVPTILNTISAAAWCDIYPDMDAAIKGNKEIDDLKISFNLMVQQINGQLEAKRKNMMTLSNPEKKPLKLVTAQA